MEFVGIPDGENAEDYLSHYGVKGMKWRHHKGKSVTDEIDDLKSKRNDALDRRLRASNAEASSRKMAQRQNAKRSADIQTKGRNEIGRRTRVRIAVNKAAAKGAALRRARSMTQQGDMAGTKSAVNKARTKAKRSTSQRSYRASRNDSANSNYSEGKIERMGKQRKKRQSTYRMNRVR